MASNQINYEAELHRFIGNNSDSSKAYIRHLVEEKHVNINSKSPTNGSYALNNAINSDNYYKDYEIAKYLINQGANVNVKQSSGRTPLFFAINNMTDYELIELLIKKGADVNHRDTDGDTPLHAAVFYNNRTAIQMLIDAGADRSIKNNDGYTPEELARNEGDDNDLADFIRDYESLPDIKEPDLDYDTDY